MKQSLIKLVLAAMVGVTLLPASAVTTLGYGTVRPRSTEDSTGGPSLLGTPPPTFTAPIPNGGGAGSLCGNAAVYTDNYGITSVTPCQGHQVLYKPMVTTYTPAVPAYYDSSSGQFFPEVPGYYTTAPSYYPVADCPANYTLVYTGSRGPYEYSSCAAL